MKPRPLEFPLEINLRSGQKASVTHATKEDISEVKKWKGFARKGSTPAQRAAVKMALNALREWNDARETMLAAGSLSEAKDMKNENPNNDVYLLMCIKTSGFPHGQVIGVFLVRRNWWDSLFADYIATHPLLAKNPKGELRGIGTVAFYTICLIARELRIRKIWGEATAFSKEFYELIMQRPVYDMVSISKRRYEEFLRKLEPPPEQSGP